MAFPSTSGSHPDTLDRAWDGARSVAAQIKQQAQTLKDRSLLGPVDSSAILFFINSVADAKLFLIRYAAVPGIAAYAQAQVGDATLNVATEFNAMVAALDTLRDWAMANFPKDANGFLLAKQFSADGRTTDRQFNTASLATFRTQLDALTATID